MDSKNENTNSEADLSQGNDATATTALTKSFVRPEDLSKEQLQQYNLKHRLVTMVENGCSPSKALSELRQSLSELGMKGTVRWIYKLRDRNRLHGASGLLDRRTKNKSSRRLFTSKVEELTLTFWYGRPAAGPKAVWELVKDECKRIELPCPGYDTVKKFLKNQPEHHKLVRAGKIRVWDKQGRSVGRVENTSRANERWQADHTHLDVWIREWVNGQWIPCAAHLSVFMDAHTRAICGASLSKRNPDSWTVLMLLRLSILPKAHPDWMMQGIPRIIQPDRGADWMSRAVALAVAYAGIEYDPDAPYYPNGKGKIERWFETLDIGKLRKLPGHKLAIGKSYTSAKRHVAELLELHELRDEIIKFIVETHHEREHSETKRKPAEHWLETVDLRVPESEDALDEMLLKADRNKTVKNTGVDFTCDGHRGHYWSPQVADYWKQEVQVRYNPEDLNSILLYSVDKNEFLCEAFLMGKPDSRFTIGDIKRNRNQFRRGLIERQKLYVKKIEEFDRPRREKAQREKTEAILARKAEKKAARKKPSGFEGAFDLLERIERRARGEE